MGKRLERQSKNKRIYFKLEYSFKSRIRNDFAFLSQRDKTSLLIEFPIVGSFYRQM